MQSRLEKRREKRHYGCFDDASGAGSEKVENQMESEEKEDRELSRKQASPFPWDTLLQIKDLIEGQRKREDRRECHLTTWLMDHLSR